MRKYVNMFKTIVVHPVHVVKPCHRTIHPINISTKS
jgi:hypothetical protein